MDQEYCFTSTIDILKPMKKTIPDDIVDIESIGNTEKKQTLKTIDFQDLPKLKEIVIQIIDGNIIDRKKLNSFLLEIRRKERTQYSLTDLLFAYRCLCKEGKYQYDTNIEYMFLKKRYRSHSGVVVVALLTSPYPDGQEFSCEFDCWYCPKQPGQPRSYLLDEPGVLRANRNKFDPIAQVWDRLLSLDILGHPIDKLEIIVLG
jgi:histone acetyltransferase (RNA polymerase elongator complex component)